MIEKAGISDAGVPGHRSPVIVVSVLAFVVIANRRKYLQGNNQAHIFG